MRKLINRRFLFLGIVGFVFVNIVSFSYFHLLNESFKTQIYENLKEYSAKNAEILKTRIDGESKELKMISATLPEVNEQNREKLLEQINQKEIKGNFLRLSIVNNKGRCFTVDGQTFGIQKESYYTDAIKGKTAVSDMFMDRVNQVPIVLYSTPLKDAKGTITGALIGVQSTSYLMQSAMDMKQYEDSFSIILDAKGHIALPTQSLDASKHLEGLDRQYLTMQKNGGITTYYSKSKDMEFLVSYIPLHLNNWYVTAFVPAYHATAMSRNFNFLSTAAVFVIALIVIGILCYLHRVRKKNQKEKEELLFHDPLTDGKNYSWFQIACEDHKKAVRWLIILDIADFGMINRMYGYPKGDALLYELAQILRQTPILHCPIRKENDSFLAWIEESDQNQIEEVLQNLIDDVRIKLQERCSISDIHIYCGLALWEESEELPTVLDKTRRALRDATNLHPISLYTETMMSSSLMEKLLEAQMESALKNEEFKVYVQPKVDAQSGRIVAGEALVRWQNKDELIAPWKFIPLFERNGFLQQVDFYVYQRVCDYVKKWEEEGLSDIRISFNVSPTYIFQKGYIEKMCTLAQTLGIQRDRLEVEITESAMVEDERRLAAVIQQFHEAGYRIAMDDFGSGYSSLHMLKELPIDTLKIDQDFFVQEERYRKKSECIVTMIMKMAKELNMEIVAEGIETKEQLAVIQKSGCDLVQGYYFYQPMPIEEFEELIKKERAL